MSYDDSIERRLPGLRLSACSRRHNRDRIPAATFAKEPPRMSLQVLTTINNVTFAFDGFVRHFKTEGELLERNLTPPGGNETTTLRWYPELKFWVMLQPDRLDSRHWCAFGIDDPNENSMLPITCEI